nr:GNAT family N-acetyltransferase [uncultured Rhodoferax sp.]
MHSFEQLILQTERLVLRPLGDADAPALFAIFSDPQVMRYWSTPPWASIDEAHSLVARDQAGMATGDYLRCGIVLKDTSALVGTCTLFSIQATCRRAEVGYGLAHAAWGHGYMHEALRALLAYGFSEMNLNRIEADIDPRNTASAQSLERLGFLREGFLRERWIVNGEVSDTALYGLLQREWVAG